MTIILVFLSLFFHSITCVENTTDMSTKSFTGHLNGIESVYVYDNFLYSGSSDGTIRKFNVITGVIDRTFRGHKNSVLSVWVIGSTLISGSADKSIKKWNIKGGVLATKANAHDGYITSVVVGPCTFQNKTNCIFSTSTDKSIKKWELENFNLINTWYGYPTFRTGHRKTVYSIHVAMQPFRDKINPFIYSASSDGLVKQWDTSANVCYQTYKCHTDQVLVVLTDPNRKMFYTGSKDMTVMQHNNDFPLAGGQTVTEPFRTFKGHTGPVWGLTIQGSVLYSASTDGTVKAWDVETGELLKDYTSGGLEFYSIVSDATNVYAGASEPYNNTKQFAGINKYIL